MDTPPASASSEPPPSSKTPPLTAREPRQRFPRRLRVSQRQDFEQALRHGLRLRDELLTVWARLNGLDVTRLGLMVGRKHGKAVQRNRLKRLIREGFRLSHATLPRGVDLICAPAPKAKLTLDGVKASLKRLQKRLVQRLPQVGFDIRTLPQNNHGN